MSELHHLKNSQRRISPRVCGADARTDRPAVRGRNRSRDSRRRSGLGADAASQQQLRSSTLPPADPGRPARAPHPPTKLTGHLLTSLPRSGTMFAVSWRGSMWRATWILYFSFYVLSARAQGRKDAVLLCRRRGSARLGSARRDRLMPPCVGYSAPFISPKTELLSCQNRRRARPASSWCSEERSGIFWRDLQTLAERHCSRADQLDPNLIKSRSPKRARDVNVTSVGQTSHC